MTIKIITIIKIIIIINKPPVSCISYKAYSGTDNIRISGRNFSIKECITSVVDAVLETRIHFVATFCPAS